MVTCSSQVKSKKDIWYCRLKRLSRMKNSSCLDLAPVCLDYTFKAYLNSDNYLGTPNLREYHNVQKFIRSLIFSIFTNFVIYLGFFTQTWIRFAQEMNILTCISEKFRDIFGDFHPPCKKKSFDDCSPISLLLALWINDCFYFRSPGIDWEIAT